MPHENTSIVAVSAHVAEPSAAAMKHAVSTDSPE